MIETSDTLRLEVELLEEITRRKEEDRLRWEYWDHGSEGFPYDWQERWHNAGRTNRCRAIFAGNRLGKTRTGARETAIHTTGRYPPWWKGRVYRRPVNAWVGSPTNETCRDSAQIELLGTVDENRRVSGTGAIPKEAIAGVTFKQCGVSLVVDTVKVRHVSGGLSTITFKTYEQGAVKWQAAKCDIIWLDEEPESSRENQKMIFSEAQARLFDSNGLLYMTRTPLFGMNDAYRFFHSGLDGVYVEEITWDQVGHLTEEAKVEMWASWPEHERETRAKGAPMMGHGAVYPISDEQITCDPIEIPGYWRRIVGLDFGIGHATAAVWLAHDADTDTVYVYDCYKCKYTESGYGIPNHASAIRSRGDWIPVAWPHDGHKRDFGAGLKHAEQYRDEGVNMLHISARWEDDKGGGQSKNAAAEAMLIRMRTGRIKVFKGLHEWFVEKRNYHRKDGVINPINDDLMKATDYAVMMLRYATTSTRNTPSVKSVAGYDPMRRR